MKKKEVGDRGVGKKQNPGIKGVGPEIELKMVIGIGIGGRKAEVKKDRGITNVKGI